MDPIIDEAVRHLATVSGVDCLALELTDEWVVRSTDASGPSTAGCAVCDAAFRGHLSPRRADAIHRFAAYQSERLGGSYIYVCSYALMHVTAPVLVGDTLHGALVCGPTVLGEVDHQVIEAIESLAVGSLMSTDAIVAWLDSLPRLAPWEASSFSDVVFRIALSCCDREGAEYLSAVPEHKTSSDIGPYLDYLTSMEGEKHSSMRYPIEKESRLMAHVAAGDRTGAEKTLREILEAVSTNRVTDAEEARSRVLELVVLLSRAAIAGGAEVEQVFGLEYRSLTRLRTLSSVDEIARWLSRILKRFVDLVFDLRHLRYAAHLSSALRLMHNSFRERVTLSDAAAAAGLSSGYLARIFRRELRCSFTTYLNRIRIQEAKRLLRTTSMQIGEIGAASGITDHSYFTQAFRRETGLTPRHYRNRIRDHRQQRR